MLELGGDESVENSHVNGTPEGIDGIAGPQWANCFNKAYDCIGMKQSSEDLLKRGVSIALGLQKVRHSTYIHKIYKI